MKIKLLKFTPLFLLPLFILSSAFLYPQTSGGAAITIYSFTSDDSTAVVKYAAYLKDVNGFVLKTAYSDSNKVVFSDIPTPVENDKVKIPKNFKLYQNYPNPFNPRTVIEFELPAAELINITVFDILGREVKLLVNEVKSAGVYNVIWNGRNNSGEQVSEGIYFYRLTGSDFTGTKKMVYLHGSVPSEGYSFSAVKESRVVSLNKINSVPYTIEIASTDSTNPEILSKSISINLSADTSFSAYLDRKPVTITVNVFTDNGSTSVTGYNAILKDTLDNVIEQITAAGNQAVFTNKPANRFYRMQIQNTSSTIPSINDTVFRFKAVSDTLFNVNSSRKAPRTISGVLTDDEGNVKSGYILAYNANGDSAVAMAGADGRFTIAIKSSEGDTLKAQIYNPGHAEGFIRKLYVPGSSDADVIMDAVPSLADSSYIGLDTLASFAWEANFQPLDQEYYEGLKKADLDNLKEVISSYYSITGDTIKTDEQLYIKNIIETRIDPFFKKPSSKYLVPQDSTMNSPNPYAVNWFKKKNGQLGSISTWDLNRDGIMEGAGINLLYIMNISGQDTVYNSGAIMQEGLSARIAPGEVGITSTITNKQTVLHKNVALDHLQPADIWLVKIAEGYAPKTSYYNLLVVGNLKPAYERLKK